MKLNRKYILVTILVIALGLLTMSLAFADESGQSAYNWATPNASSSATGAQGVAAAGGITITHSTSPTVLEPGSVACSPDQGASTTENSYWRVFDLAGDFGITGDFDITNVQFGVEQSTGPGGSGTNAISVNLYTLSGPFTTANLTLIGSGVFNVADGALFLYDAAVAGTAPAGSILVVEVSSPDLSGVGAFFIGSNNDGQTDPSYISSASCGIPQPTDLAAIGFPNMHLVFNVSGNESTGGNPSIAIDKSPATQEIVIGGNADFTITVTNTGDVNLVNVAVSDPLVPACDNAVGALAAGASTSYTCQDVGVAASYTNVATVTSDLDTGGAGPTATASADVTANDPTSVSLSGFGEDAAAFSPVWLVAVLAVVLALGFIVRRKLTA